MGKEEEEEDGIIVQIRREDGGEWKGRENEKSRASVKNKPPFSMATSTTRIGQIAPTQTQGVAAIVSRKRTTGQFSNKLWKYLFLAHLLTIAILITVLSVTGFLAAGKRKFHPIHWYRPILTSYACSTLVAIAWLSTTLNYPLKALKASLWLAPLLTFALAIFLLDTTSTGFGLAFGVLALIFSPIQCFYGCWASPRLNYTSQILTTSISATTQVTVRIAKFIAIALVAGVIYSSFWTLGVGGVTAGAPRLAPLYIFILLLSLAWTMQVIRNTVQVAIGRVAYMNLAHGVAADVPEAFRDACTRAMGHICLGSAVVPTVGAFRGVARAMNQVAGDHDEFLFSCANCYKGLADWLVAFGNRWGFVRVGSHGRGFVEASRETWEMFTRLGMEGAVDSDLTSSFCFLCGVAGAAFCGLAAGIWVVVVDKSYVTGVTVYAFIIGYLMIASNKRCSVAQFLHYFRDNPQLLCRRRRLNAVQSQEMVFMLSATQFPRVLRGEEDNWNWQGGKAQIFSVKAAYALFTRQPLIEREWKHLWKLKIPLKARLFIWQVCQQKIPTKEYLLKLGLELDGSCLCCCLFPESLDHLLCKCEMVYSVWIRISGAFGISSAFNSTLMAIWRQWDINLFTGTKKLLWEVLPAAIVWNIWCHRNAAIFSGQEFQTDAVIKDSILMAASWVDSIGISVVKGLFSFDAKSLCSCISSII